MTYGVPYSFTPGTKARADEMNANFIDILNKLEDINSKLNETNANLDSSFAELDTKIDNVNSSINSAKLNTDLSNISSQGQSLFDAKANLELIDGSWINHHWSIVLDMGIKGSELKYFSLIDYLPKDGQRYDVVCSLSCQSLNGYANLYSGSDILNNAYTVRCNKNYDSCKFTMPVGTQRWISIYAHSGTTNNDCKFLLEVEGYRKVR